MKTIGKIFLVLLCVVVALYIGRNMIVKGAVKTGVSLVTGLKLDMKKLDIGIFSTHLKIEGLTIRNPRGYEEKTMLDMPAVTIDYNLGNILKGLIHLEEVVINLKEFNIVRNSKGELNLDALKVVQEGKEEGKKPAKEKPKAKKPAPKMQIDRLVLKFGHVAFMNYEGRPNDPKINKIEMNINEEYTDITNPQVIAAIIINKAIAHAALAKISGFELGGISDSLNSAVGNVTQLTSQALSGTADMGKQAVGQVTDAGSKAAQSAKQVSTDAAQKAADTAKQAGAALADKTKKLTSLLKVGSE